MTNSIRVLFIAVVVSLLALVTEGARGGDYMAETTVEVLNHAKVVLTSPAESERPVQVQSDQPAGKPMGGLPVMSSLAGQKKVLDDASQLETSLPAASPSTDLLSILQGKAGPRALMAIPVALLALVAFARLIYDSFCELLSRVRALAKVNEVADMNAAALAEQRLISERNGNKQEPAR